MEDLKLHGFWYSPFTMRVVWTLKLKGLSYENIEEDRFNKSPQLLEYNPVHKKTPVLVHGGKPICESMIIVQYIDELWPQNPLVPHDSYERAQARFWVAYSEQMVPALPALIQSTSAEEKEKAVQKAWENFKVLEDHCLADKRKFFGGDKINIVDIAIGSFFVFFVTIEDLKQVKILVAEKFPLLHLWFDNFKNAPVIKENFPDREKMLATMKAVLERRLASS
ncbi:glutathione transferase GST 23-like [Arachis stenosperma]|uniref:glutathione transferase GST 23-like n=1 Tax=Arachis stenosperma TaxID=217475 RepID=UPI0025AC58C3|nr:glutathione transferase GST 23-like [Arachis stenosperma]